MAYEMAFATGLAARHFVQARLSMKFLKGNMETGGTSPITISAAISDSYCFGTRKIKTPLRAGHAGEFFQIQVKGSSGLEIKTNLGLECARSDL